MDDNTGGHKDDGIDDNPKKSFFCFMNIGSNGECYDNCDGNQD